MLAADTPTWTTAAGFWVAAAAAVISVASFVVAWVYGHRNANTAAQALQVSKEAAQTAKDSMEVARQSAESAATMARAELERDHEAYRPRLSGAFVIEENRTGNGVLFYDFTASDRSYRAAGMGVRRDGSKFNLTVPLVVKAGEMVRVQVDVLQVIDGQRQAPAVPVEFLHLRFWPPGTSDDVAWWTCSCERPTDSSGPLHWEVRVPVGTPTDNRIFVFRD